jgi:hypothetical protein
MLRRKSASGQEAADLSAGFGGIKSSCLAGGMALRFVCKNNRAIVNNYLFPKRNPCCFHEHKTLLYFPDLASRVTILNAEDSLAAQLGDGRETDCKTNRPGNQTNPALFAEPHSFGACLKNGERTRPRVLLAAPRREEKTTQNRKNRRYFRSAAPLRSAGAPTAAREARALP